MTTSLQESGREFEPEDVATSDDNRSHGHNRLGLALLVISIAQLMVVLDATIANIAIPYIAKDLDFSTANQSWIITGYTLAFGGLLLLGGRLGDMFGRRRIFMVGVVLFAVASLLGGLAQNQELLLGARAIQGIGAAIASPTALALITTTFPAGAARNRAFAVYAAMSGAGAAVGLILGGWLTEYSWRLTFLINVPIGVAAALLAPMVLAESTPRKMKLDVPGAVTGTAGLLGIVYGLTHAANLVAQNADRTWSAPSVVISLGAGIALLVAFIAVERTVAEPLMPFRILANRTRGVSFAVMMLIPAAMFAMFYFLSVVIHNSMGYSSLKTGFAFLPFSAGIIVSATIASTLMGRVDPRWLAGFGATLAGVGIFGFSRLPYDTAVTSVGDLANLGVHASYVQNLLPWIVTMSFGMGFVFVPLTLTAVHGVSQDDAGIGSGVLNAMQQIGGALGLAILSTVAINAAADKAGQIGASVQGLGGQLAGASPDDQAALKQSIANVAFAHGSTHAFLVGAFMIWAGAALAFILMNVKHEEINDVEAPVGVMA